MCTGGLGLDRVVADALAQQRILAQLDPVKDLAGPQRDSVPAPDK